MCVGVDCDVFYEDIERVIWDDIQESALLFLAGTKG